MKIDRRRRALIAVSSLTLFSVAQALVPKDTPATYSKTQHSSIADRTISDESTIASITTEHAPLDGKDGIPRNGPWVQTNAERERKKTKKTDDDDEDGNDEPASLTKFKNALKTKEIPETNNGVMDDPGRKAPAEGTRGTEGGVSEKSKKDGSATSEETISSKKPASPKEPHAVPYTEKEKAKKAADMMMDDSAHVDEDTKTKKMLEKPKNLPEKPHSLPHPENPSSPDHKIMIDDPHKGKSSKTLVDGHIEESAVIQPLHSLFLSFTMILFSEIGDKTFLVACLMAMRHDRILVFTAAFSALFVMTVLSALLGHTVPALIPKSVTNFLAAGLFLVFGVRMLLEARKISPDEGVSEEMKEVEMELEEKEQKSARRMSRHQSNNLVSPYMLESGRGRPSSHSPSSSVSSSRSASPSGKSTIASITSGFYNLFSLLLSPAWVQTFVMTFLGEWGDRSQIATIAMAAGQDYWWVIGGALGGHAICTGAAVIGGKAIAGRVSLRTVTMGGAGAFLVFGVIYLLEALY